MTIRKDIKIRAKRLVQMSIGANGLVDTQRVSGVVAYIKTSAASDQIPLFKAYKQYLEQYLKAHTAVVEMATALSNSEIADLHAKLEKRFEQKLDITTKINSDLLGGVRVTINDTIYDDSVTGKFEQIKKGIIGS